MASNGSNDPQPDEIPEDQRIGGEPSPSGRSQSKAPPPPANHENSAARRVPDSFRRRSPEEK
jgi:hypothetical protein